MDPSSRPQHHQDMASHQTLESMLVCTKAAQAADKKPRPAEQALKCPRCDSSNTKFCYFNNYSLTQPRYFCKSCRRYWTKGGTLRNVPVGGGCRKNKRSSSSNYSSSSKIRTQDQQHPLITANHNGPLLSYDSTDLSLAFARLQNGQLGFDHQHHENDHFSLMGNPSNTHGFLDALRSGFLETPINGFQNVYFGNNMVSNGGDHMGNVENVGGMSVNVSEEMGNLPYEDLMSGSSGATTAVTVTTVKQEGCNGSHREAAAAESGRVLWGYPWQVGGGDGGSIMGDVDAAGRQSSWINGLGSSNWHGLLNSPLM